MAGPHRTIGRLIVVILTATALAATLGATAAPVALGTSHCRVRNATQGTAAHSIRRMVARARDGDVLWVRGTCVGPIVIDVDIVIRGADDTAVLSGDDPQPGPRQRYRVIRIRPGANVTLRRLVVQYGRARSAAPYPKGGGILNQGRLRLVDSRVLRSDAYLGGGIYNDGVLRMVRSEVAENGWLDTWRTYFGGGIYNAGTAILVDSVIRDGNAKYYGGGLYNEGTMTLTRTLVSGNGLFLAWSGGGVFNKGRLTLADSSVTSSSDGGGIGNSGTLLLVRSTVSANSVAFGAGGIHSVGGRVTLRDSSVTDNTSSWGNGGILNRGDLRLEDTAVTGNTGVLHGGGIRNARGGTVTILGTSTISGNTPDDCYGTPAC